ncbi:hypothetical protein ACSQ67_021319 [Phaseolus vulgaris]
MMVDTMFGCYPKKYHANRGKSLLSLATMRSLVYMGSTWNPQQTAPTTKELVRELEPFGEEELKNLRGDGTGKREKWDRIYDYDVYNDPGFLTRDGQHDHPVLGGIKYPYLVGLGLGENSSTITRMSAEYEEPHEVHHVPRDENFSNMKAKEVVELGTKTLAELVALIFTFKDHTK